MRIAMRAGAGLCKSLSRQEGGACSTHTGVRNFTPLAIQPVLCSTRLGHKHEPVLCAPTTLPPHRPCSMPPPSTLRRPPGAWTGHTAHHSPFLPSTQALQYASSLYPQTPPWCLDWAHRLPLMMREVAHWRPDVVCMQVWGMN